MAEVKKIEEYDVSTPVVQEEVIAPVSDKAKKRLKNISRFEKMLIVGIILVFLALSVVTIKLTTTISKAEADITTIEGTITTNQDKINELEQEKNELSRNDRIKQIAEKAGLESNDDNIRKVTK